MISIPRDSELSSLVHRPTDFVRRYRISLAFLLAAATADVVTTINALRNYGVDAEVHLVQRLVVQIFGLNAGVPLAKIIQLGFVIFVAAWWRPWCRWILLGCGVLYTLAAISNHFVLL